jgi:hypothetical protein
MIGGEMPNRQLLEPPPVNDPSRHGLSFSGSREKADFPAALVGRANPAPEAYRSGLSPAPRITNNRPVLAVSAQIRTFLHAGFATTTASRTVPSATNVAASGLRLR